ncbi:hypothetical protein [Streptomyces canus]|uniref:hypothetical protein n=1 Tax=Streptomyces canus TaxID=58343 RepID=UPI000A9F7016|nr:hypothetical protein [Streptomyces canus]
MTPGRGVQPTDSTWTGSYVTRVPDPTARRRVRVAALPDAVANVVAFEELRAKDADGT